MVMVRHCYGIPVVWTISSSHGSDDISFWLGKVVAEVRKHKPDWMPSSFLVDDPDAEQTAIR